ncbi:MAG: hypothetical protein IJS66_04775 [Bacteroidales bacterium]|nr:hypothetical protein [Bacteroidales bacterium]
MKIIVESGATKSQWTVIGDDGAVRLSKRFRGINFSTMPADEIRSLFSGALSELGAERAEGFYLYSAGLVPSELEKELKKHLHDSVEVGTVEFNDDLTAAARALFGREKGIVAILGTGSNCCYYDGSTLESRVRSGGFILGDEGSGAVLGKLFVSDYLKGLVPERAAKEFEARYDASYMAIVQNVYRSAAPSAWLGSLAPFILSFYDSEPYVAKLVDSNFKSFIDRVLSRYDTASLPLGVTGSFGCACSAIFSRLCAEAGIQVAKYMPDPTEGLLEYHR